ncbi:MAG TPA: long-chain fatty acid--CoA ligase [Candidatus Eisenbacteria bacterium]|jgi:long-chain acyl-CoA synthetase|nr:long-chain fatty acid--CoA ligase [Candidatus Eisenbacteria bacterium]
MSEQSLARMFWNRVEKSAGSSAQKFKQQGTWKTLTWREVGNAVRELAAGLAALGRRPADAVGILSTSRAEWVQADFAIFSAGCVTIPIYPTYPPDLIEYIVNDAGVKTLIVEDPTQLAKVLEVDKAMPGLEQIVIMQGYEGREPSPRTFTWEALRRLGRERADSLKAELANRVDGIKRDDVATIVYTSGTTGPPKGVVQTHGNHLSALESAAQTTSIAEGNVHLLFLPLAHSFARLESFIGVHRGLCTAFAESIDKLRENLPETQPHFICSVPRVFEKVYAGAMARAEGGSPVKRKIFNWAVGIGKDVSRLKQANRPVPTALALQYKLAEKLVFSKMQAALGGRLRFAVSGGAPLSREIAEFFHAAGILILEGYGLTETCPVLTNNREDAYKFGSVGKPMPGVDVKIAADGEILGRGGNIAKGYFKKTEATREVFLEDGWFATGDIGRFDEDGFLFITDRKKDLIVTAGGMNIAPQNIENLLKGDPFISQVMVHGDRRPYPVALITLNPEELAKFAREQGIMAGDPSVLAKHPKVVERVQRTVDHKNSELQSYAKIKKFVILPEDFTVENGALTPTLKVKRKVISERHRPVLDALYQ